MSESRIDAFFMGCFIGMIAFIIVLQIVSLGGTNSPEYKQGQIDAQTGKINWVLTKNTDGTTTWEHVK
jgi:hypothetical protein